MLAWSIYVAAWLTITLRALPVRTPEMPRRWAAWRADPPGVLSSAGLAVHQRATRGDGAAENLLGDMYALGLDAPELRDMARKWYELSALDGYRGAYSYADPASKASAIRSGRATERVFLATPEPQMVSEQTKWLLGLSRSGNPKAQYLLGLQFSDIDARFAKKWLSRSAASGYASAIAELRNPSYAAPMAPLQPWEASEHAARMHRLGEPLDD